MTIAWCLFHAAQWQCTLGIVGTSLGVQPQSVSAAVLAALLVSVVSLTFYTLICFYSVSFHGNQWNDGKLGNFQVLTAAAGFAVALPWVTAFSTSLSSLAVATAPSNAVVVMPVTLYEVNAVAALVALVLVLPMWGAFIL